jgi:hypothetical protein
MVNERSASGEVAMKSILVGMTLVLISWAASCSAASDGTISDPKLWCEQFAQTIADKDNDKMLEVFLAATMTPVAKADAAQGFSAIPPLLAREGEFRLTDFLAERDYGKSLVRLWYMVLFDHGPVFMRCELVKPVEKWAVHGVFFQTDLKQIDLP